MMESTQVIEFKNHYKQQVIDLILDIQTKEFEIPITLNEQPDLQHIPSFYQKNNGNFWVVIEGEKVIGTIALIDIGNAQCALRKMFVMKEYRGKHKAISQKLLDTVFNWCKSKKIREIYLGTVSILHAAQRFYEKNGFKEISKNELPKNFPLMEVDTKFYVFSLGTE